MKTAFIIHGFNGDTTCTFGPWLENELKNAGYNVIMPLFPIRSQASFLGWSNILDKYKNFFSDDTILIAHSIGNPFIIKYLFQNNLKLKLYISVAGFCKLFSVPNRDDLTNAFIDFAVSDTNISYFKENVSYKYSLYSNNDHVIPFDILEDFFLKINSNPVFIPNVGHMGNKDNISKIPQIMEILQNYI